MANSTVGINGPTTLGLECSFTYNVDGNRPGSWMITAFEDSDGIPVLTVNWQNPLEINVTATDAGAATIKWTSGTIVYTKTVTVPANLACS